MFGSILQRSIFFELARVFLLSLVGITGVLLMAGVVAEASQQGLGPAQILAVIPLLIPSTLPYTIPATTLFATCVVYGRLSADNEILAIKSAGVNVLTVVRPAVVLGLLMAVTTMALYYRLIPYTHLLLRSQFLNEVEESLYAMLKKDRCINQPGLNYSMWVRQVQGKHLYGALFKRRDPRTHQHDVIARAREAELNYEAKGRRILVRMRHCYLSNEKGDNVGYVHERVWEVPLPEDFGFNKNSQPRALAFPDLLAHLRRKREEAQAKQAEIALAAARLAMSHAPPDLPRHLDNLRAAKKSFDAGICNLEHEIQLRPALAFGCVCFVLVGCPVGIWFGRSDYLSAFVSCFLPIVFIYYPLLLCATNVTKAGRIPAEIAMWTPDLVLVGAALVLFRQLAKN